MAGALRLIIENATAGSFSFDVEGEWTPRIAPVYKAASNPPALEQLLWSWEFRGCRIVPSDGSTATLWTDIQALFARFEDRSDHPTHARLVRDPDGAAVEVLRIGSPTYEGLRFEAIEGELDPDVPGASWSTTGTFALTITANRKFADANGIVGFAQEVRVRYESGLRVLEWDTTITTEEGTSAVDKAKVYASIDISPYPFYTYQTNGPDGIEFEILDADEANARTATQVQAISRIREWGVSIGATGGGVAPDEVFLSVRTTTEPDEIVTVTNARARGPNAEQWVLAQRPSGKVSVEETDKRTATAEFEARWEQRKPNNSATDGDGYNTTITVAISGGGRAVRLRPIAGGFPPLVQRGAFLPYSAEVGISVRRQGGSGTVAELPLPPLLGSPWILDTERSRVGEPTIVERGNDPSQHVWERSASLAYLSATTPARRVADELRQGVAVPGYLI